jgi:DNA-binding winged helix-turn-helix (wHTH) protein/Tol biopolymer transport system component
VRIKLQEQPFRVLVELVANSGNLVSREDLHKKLWPADTFVDFDVGLNSAIRKLRQALSDDAENPRYIETLAKRGYRFVAPVADVVPAVPPISRDSPAQAPVSLSDDGTGPATGEEIQRESRRWYWVLAAACVLALVAYGALVAWRRANTTPPLFTEQRITANPSEAPVTGAVVSPDGKYVAYADTTGVYIRHIDTGETRPLQLPKGLDAVPTSWFPDGAHLLLGTGEADYGHGLTGKLVTPSVWRVSILGGSPQEFIENASGAAVSPDGSKIAFLRGDARASRGIWVMGSDGSNPHRIVEAAVPENSITDGNGASRQSYPVVSLSGVAWSPDGGRVAYVRRFEVVSPGPTPDKRSLETVDVSSGISKVVKISTHLLPVVCWAADGRLLHAHRDDPASKFGDSGIWSVRVNQKSGEAEGKPLQLTRGIGQIAGMSITADARRLILLRANFFPQVYLTEIDAGTRHFKAPRRLTLDENPNGAYAWTFDSRAVLFNSSRSGTFKLYRQDIDQAVPEVLMERHGSFMPRLNPDGTQVLFVAEVDPENPALPQNLMSVPLQGGAPRLVLQKRSIGNFQCARSPSKLCLLATLEGSTVQIFSFDPEDGKTHEFATFKVKDDIDWSLSPDGAQLALIFHGSESRITFMAVSDKSSHEVELKPWPLLSIDWSADGNNVFVPSRTEDGAAMVLGVQPNGSYQVLLEGDRATQYWWVIPSPDGHYAALEVLKGTNNVWMVENF